MKIIKWMLNKMMSSNNNKKKKREKMNKNKMSHYQIFLKKS